MTRPAAHARRAGQPDPITDSGLHQFALGTQIRLHTFSGYVDCGLLNVDGVTTWHDVVMRVTQGWPIEVNGPRRNAFGGGVVLRVECLSDPLPDTVPPGD